MVVTCSLPGTSGESSRRLNFSARTDIPHPVFVWFCICQRYDKAQRLFEAGLENCVDNPYLLQAFAVMEEQRGNQAKVTTISLGTSAATSIFVRDLPIIDCVVIVVVADVYWHLV